MRFPTGTRRQAASAATYPREGLETALEELDIPRRRRDIALAHLTVCNLAGLGNVPEHRGVSPFPLVGAPRSLLIRMHHRGVHVEGHAILALQARLQETAVDCLQGIP